ncbi:MAG: PadR family transcriptional regulator [Gemmatimonadales bacterium]
MSSSRTLPSGSVDVLLLKAISWGPRHGFAISRWLQTHSSGAFRLDDAALYQGLHRSERNGWVSSEWGPSENNRRAKYYTLTAKGEQHLRAESTAWRDWATALFSVLDLRTSEG